MSYVGRFAPSPTGPLHLGSLCTAIVSYLHARQNAGRWLVRIEDIDRSREVPGSADAILSALNAMQLHWDGAVLYQSARLPAYRAAAEELLASGLAFRCACTRKTLRQDATIGDLGPRYPGTCRHRAIDAAEAAIRVRVDSGPVEFLDLLQGPLSIDVAALVGDYSIFRRGGLPAYHLAVTLDDAYQAVTHVVRGCDLLLATAIHLHLASRCGARSEPQYAHVAVLTDDAGQKLSKQQGARAVDAGDPNGLALRALRALGIDVPAELTGAAPEILWDWAAENWDFQSLRGRRAIVLEPGA